MAREKDIEDGSEIDRVDGVVEDEDAELLAIITKSLEGDGEEESGRIFSEAKDAEDDMVSLEKGLDLIDAAKTGKADPKAKAKEEYVDSEEGEKEAATDAADRSTEKGGAEEPAKPDETETVADDPYADFVTGLPEDKQTEVRSRLKERDDMLAIFKGHEAEMTRFGTTPAQHVTELVKLNQYASQNPAEYLAWAAHNLGGAKAEEILSSAAAKLGLKVVPDEDEDAFEDETVKAIKKENRELKARNRTLDFGPNLSAQAPVTPDDIGRFMNEANPDGSLKRPGFGDFGPGIARLAKEHLEKTGKPATFEDLDGFYRQFAGAAQPATAPKPAPAPTPAAQPAPPVSGDQQKKAAAKASVERAKAASKSIDGTGQGASRRPALSEESSLEDTLKHFMGEFGG